MCDSPNAILVFLSFSGIAVLTWFSGTNPRFYLKTFVPKEDLWEMAREIRNNPDWKRGHQIIACLQLLVGLTIGIVMYLTS